MFPELSKALAVYTPPVIALSFPAVHVISFLFYLQHRHLLLRYFH